MIRFIILLTLTLGAYAHETEEPTIEQIAKAIASVETGENWNGKKGRYGEIGKWQILPTVLRERGCSPVGNYQDFRRVFLYFRSRTKSWQEACAAYHRGLGGINKKEAQDYAQRVANLIAVQ